jgi:glycosyltransferase involved in cell wall biosynthesis
MITYAVTTHNEGRGYIEPLLKQLLSIVTPQDEIIVLDDFSDDPETVAVLKEYSDHIKLIQHKFIDNFADHKNQIHQYAKGEYIFQIDADELLGINLMHQLSQILELNPSIDVLGVPRENYFVEGLTPADVAKWHWRVDSLSRVMWPDFQFRIYKNDGTIYWTGNVHETLISSRDTNIATLPEEPEWALIHKKHITRQRLQNELYESL